MGYYNQPPTSYAAELSELERLLRALLPADGVMAGLDLLETLSRNIVQNPTEEKYRKLRTTNAKLQTLFGLQGAMEVMAEMGWEQDGDENLVLPKGKRLDFQKHIVVLLEAKSWHAKQKEKAKQAANIANKGDASKANTLRELEIDRRERAAAEASRNGAVATNGGGGGYAAATGTLAPKPEPVARRTEAAASVDSQAAQAAAARAQAPTPAAAPAPAAAAAAAAPAAAPQSEAASKATSKPQSAFDFQNRSKVEEAKKEGEMSLADLRALQKDKYKQFEADPNARKGDAYQRPASTGGSSEEGWFSWMWGGSSSSSSGGGGGGKDDKRPPGPRMKTINDLPKPVQRGG